MRHLILIVVALALLAGPVLAQTSTNTPTSTPTWTAAPDTGRADMYKNKLRIGPSGTAFDLLHAGVVSLATSATSATAEVPGARSVDVVLLSPVTADLGAVRYYGTVTDDGILTVTTSGGVAAPKKVSYMVIGCPWTPTPTPTNTATATRTNTPGS